MLCNEERLFAIVLRLENRAALSVYFSVLAERKKPLLKYFLVADLPNYIL